MQNKSEVDRLSSYVFAQSRFYTDLETREYDENGLLYTMRHMHRANFTGKAPKSLHYTKNIKVIWNHAAVKCINHYSDTEKCKLHWVDTSIGYLLHFRRGVNTPDNCTANQPKECAIYDPVLLKYRNRLEVSVKSSLGAIFHNSSQTINR